MGQLEFESKWKKRFEQFAQGHTDAAVAGWSESGLEARIQFFKRFCQPYLQPMAPHHHAGSSSKGSAGTLWLDIGCGAGTYCRLLKEQNIEVVGLDYSLPSLCKAKASVNEIPWVAANAYELPIAPQSVQGVLCFGVLQALEKDKELCQQLYQVLKPGSELWLDGLNRWSAWHLWSAFKRKMMNKAKHLHYSHPWRIKKLLEQQGFESVVLYWAPILPKPLAWLQSWVFHPWLQKCFQWAPLTIVLFTHAFYIHAKVGAQHTDSKRAV